MTVPLVTITPFHYESLGASVTALAANLETAASLAWTTSNLAIYCPFVIDVPRTSPTIATQLFCHNGATVSGNVDVGIYAANVGGGGPGARIVSAGSTAQAGTSTLQAFDITDTPLAGQTLYYLALALSNTTGTFFMATPAQAAGLTGAGVYHQTSAFALPATATPAQASVNRLPIFGFTTRALV